MKDQVERVLAHLDRVGPGDIRGVYLYGSAVAGGLRPGSDVDILVVTRRSLSDPERTSLTECLLQVSAGASDGNGVADAAEGRPLELTSIVVDDHGNWQDPPAHDYQFGEWLRPEILAGHVLQPETDPDVPILIATAHRAHRRLRGPDLGAVVKRVPTRVLHDSMLGIIPDILEEIAGDERNTLLALARIITTLRTGEIVPKDVAAERVGRSLSGSDSDVLDRARRAYLGEVVEDWSGSERHVTGLAHALAAEARRLAQEADAESGGESIS